MIDREKTISGLKEIADYFNECRGNASFGSKAEEHFWELQSAARDAVELLKKQESIKPTVNIDTWICSKCGHTLESQELIDDKENPQVLIHEQYQYCPNCGKAVKWDDGQVSQS